ncbi:MAG TPA: DUF6603 domain-containing protein, partial [Pyrinomonadaceae bacterium]|nr:DUF6603 domain-containing protein [Pyrinomonadaceae bacterium]
LLFDALRDALGLGAGPGLPLPGGLLLTASGTNDLTLRLETGAPVGGVLDFQLDTLIDEQLNATPAGSLSLNVVGLTGGWGEVKLTFGVAPGGVTLAVEPKNGEPIQLLPTFSGLGALAAGAGAALLPSVLDALLESFGEPRPVLVNLALNVAEKFDLADPGAGGQEFSSKAENWKNLAKTDWLANFNVQAKRQNVVQALAAIFNTPGSPFLLPADKVKAQGATLTWNLLPSDASGEAEFIAGWDAGGPTFRLATNNLKVSSGPLALGFEAGRVLGGVKARATLGVNLAPALGVNLTPAFTFGLGGAALDAHLYPLGESLKNALDVELLPSPAVHAQPGGAAQLMTQLLTPIVAGLLFNEAKPHLGKKLWGSGPDLKEVLKAAKITKPNGTELAASLPPLDKAVVDFLKSLVSSVEITLVQNLKLKLVNEVPVGGGPKRFGLRLQGDYRFNVGDIELGLGLGSAGWITDSIKGLTLYLFNDAADPNAPGGYALNPLLQVIGLGVSLAGAGGSPLVNNSAVRLGGAAGYLFFDLALKGAVGVSKFGAGVELTEFGLPLGQALGGNAGGDNPVAASLLQSDGAGGGDPQPVNPAVDIVFAYRTSDGGSPTVIFRIGGSAGVFWLGVRRSFGPIYIEQIGLEQREGGNKVALLVDGQVQVSGLTVAVDDLAVVNPLRKLTTASAWALDLRGMAVGYQAPGLSIAGGLLKNPGPPVQYDGMLQVDVAGRGFTAVGSYARPKDELGEYTSLFIFVSVPIPLGGPPPF